MARGKGISGLTNRRSVAPKRAANIPNQKIVYNFSFEDLTEEGQAKYIYSLIANKQWSEVVNLSKKHYDADCFYNVPFEKLDYSARDKISALAELFHFHPPMQQEYSRANREYVRKERKPELPELLSTEMVVEYELFKKFKLGGQDAEQKLRALFEKLEDYGDPTDFWQTALGLMDEDEEHDRFREINSLSDLLYRIQWQYNRDQTDTNFEDTIDYRQWKLFENNVLNHPNFVGLRITNGSDYYSHKTNSYLVAQISGVLNGKETKLDIKVLLGGHNCKTDRGKKTWLKKKFNEYKLTKDCYNELLDAPRLKTELPVNTVNDIQDLLKITDCTHEKATWRKDGLCGLILQCKTCGLDRLSYVERYQLPITHDLGLKPEEYQEALNIANAQKIVNNEPERYETIKDLQASSKKVNLQEVKDKVIAPLKAPAKKPSKPRVNPLP